MYEKWDAQSWKDSVYLFDEFQEGGFEFANGFVPATKVKMNYNIYLGNFDMKDDSGRVYSLKKYDDMKFVRVGDHKFYYDKKLGYLEIVIDSAVSVARSSYMAWRVGAGSTSGRSFSGGTSTYWAKPVDYRDQSTEYERIYWFAEQYFIMDADHKTYKFAPSVLPSLLPQLKSDIRKYAKQNRINYKSNDDLVKMVKFCNSMYVAPDDYNGYPGKLRLAMGTTLQQSAWKDSIYRFRQFKPATVRYQGGDNEETLFNLDFFSGLKAIDAKGDTIKSKKISIVTTDDGQTFINDELFGPMEVLYYGPVNLGVKKQICDRGNFMSKSAADGLGLPFEKYYEIENTCFFIRKDKVFKATPALLMGYFPGQKQEIKKYLDQRKPDFNSPGDMTELLGWLGRL